MKKLVIIGIIFSFVACSQQNEGILISGRVINPIPGEFIKLQQLAETGLEVIDSVELDDNGQFKTYIKVDQPNFYRISFYDRQFVNLILTGEEKEVFIEADGTNPNGKNSVTGSNDTYIMSRLDSIARKKQSDIQLLNQEALQARSRGDVQTMNEITEQYYYLEGKHNRNMKSMIWESVPSLAALYAMNYINVEKEFQFADSLVNVFQASFPDHRFTKDLGKQVDGLRRLAIGANAPEISLPTPDGEIVTLSSLKGNYVLIDFWAAWCKPCRVENPNVVKLYNKYKDQNFEIYGVSLDRKKEAWLKAIDDDGLIWKHVSDLKYFNSEAAKLYNINAIPATYLIGPDGKILEKGLRGQSLRSKLKEIFG